MSASDSDDDPFGVAAFRRATVARIAAVRDSDRDPDPFGIEENRASNRSASQSIVDARRQLGATTDALRHAETSSMASSSYMAPQHVDTSSRPSYADVAPRCAGAPPKSSSPAAPPRQFDHTGFTRASPIDMPAASKSRILALRAEREERAERERATPYNVPQPSPTGELLFPCTRAPINDGHLYTASDYTVAIYVLSSDPFASNAFRFSNIGWDADFAHAFDAAASIINPGAAFKFGISVCASVRFHRRDYGYFRQGFERIVVLYCGSPNACSELERQLIGRYRAVSGCQNMAPGGEGRARPGTMECTYLVYNNALNGLSLEQFAARRAPERKTLSITVLRQAWAAYGRTGEPP